MSYLVDSPRIAHTHARRFLRVLFLHEKTFVGGAQTREIDPSTYEVYHSTTGDAGRTS